MQMLPITIIAYIIILFLKSKKVKDDNAIKKGIKDIPKLIMFFLVYFFFICIGFFISAALIGNIIDIGSDDSGLGWVIMYYSIVLGMILSPILSIIRTIKTNKKKISSESTKQTNNKKNPLLVIVKGIILLVIGGFVTLGLSELELRKNKSNDSIGYSINLEYIGPGDSSSYIDIRDNRVRISPIESCEYSNFDCTINKIFNYSKENSEKLQKFINDNFPNTKHLSFNDLTDRQNEVIQSLLLGEYFFETSIEEYKYKIEFSKNNNLSYNIYFKDDNSILVKKLTINNVNDIVSVDTHSLNFSTKNKTILNNYIEKEVEKENKNVIVKDNYSTLQKDEKNILNSMVENNESYLNNLENEPKLAYTIFYNGLNCKSPTLYLYNDNTYEYYYTFGIDNEKTIPKTGAYNYDVKKIINNIDKYQENRFGPYSIEEENGKTYTTYNTNNELKELLTSLDITLEKCLENQ